MRFFARLLCLTAADLVGSCLCIAQAHPMPVDDHTNCLECHGELVTSEHVHAAVKLGCMSCHKIDNREGASYVVLETEKASIYLECHPAVSYTYPHFPYSSGMCVRCHNPHTSSQPKLLRTAVNELCLDCHLRKAGSSASRYQPTIALSSDNRTGHPYEKHPVSGVADPLTGGEMSCISCHSAHGSGKLHQLKMASEIPEDALNHNTETNDMCRKCHMKLWGLDGAGSQKKKGKK